MTSRYQHLFDGFAKTVKGRLDATGFTSGRWVKLGDGSYTGVIIDPVSPSASSVHWHVMIDDGTGTVQEKGQAALDEKFAYLYEDNPNFDGMDIWIAFPPGSSSADGMYVVSEIDRTSVGVQFGIKPLAKQAQDAAAQPAVAQVSTLRATLNDDLTVTVGDPAEVYCYSAAITLARTEFTTDVIDLSTLAADLTGTSMHQAVEVCLDQASNELAYLTTTAVVPEQGTLPARSEMSSADFAEFDHLNHPAYMPVITVYLYDGQTGFVDDPGDSDSIGPEIRTFFPPVGAYLGITDKWDATAAPTVTDDTDAGYSVGSRWFDTTNAEEYVCLEATAGAAVWKQTTGSAGGMSSFNAAADSGTPASIADSDTLTIAGGDGVATNIIGDTITVALGAITPDSAKAIGTAGAGFFEDVAQSSNPSAPAATGWRLFATSIGRLAWRVKNGTDTFVRTIGGVFTADRLWIIPDTDDTFVGAATNQTLTNKTMTSPVINGGTIDNAAIGGTTPAAGYFSALRLKIGSFFAIFAHANTVDRTYTLRDETGTLQMQRLTTKGDILAYSTTDARLGVGSDGQVLSSASAEALGLKWVAPSSGGGGSNISKSTASFYEQTVLYDNTLGGAGVWDVSSIDQTYDHLLLRMWLRGANATAEVHARIALNNDTTAGNYRSSFTYAGSSAGSGNGSAGGERDIAYVPGDSADANSYSSVELRLDNYTKADFKVGQALTYTPENVSNLYVTTDGFQWKSTAAINRIAIAPQVGTNWKAGSRFQIIGIKAQTVVTDVTGTGTVQLSASADTTVASTAAEASLLSTINGTQTFAVNALSAVGRTLRITASGYISDTGTPTITVKFKLGSTVILTSGAVTLGSGISNKLWVFTGLITTQTAGAAGKVKAQGQFTCNGVVTDIVSTTQASVDLTATQLADLTGQFSASSASNTMTCSNCLIEVLN